MIKVEITFDEDWLLQRRDDPIYPVENVKRLIEKNFKIDKALDSDVSSLSFGLDEAEETGKASIKEKISKLINAEYDFTSDSPEYSVVISPCADGNAKNAEDKSDAEDKKDTDNKKDADNEENARVEAAEVMDRINALVGADEFKALAKEIYGVAGNIKKNGLTDIFAERNYLISINKGCGLKHYLELFADLVHKLGLVKINQMDKVNIIRASYPVNREEEIKFNIELEKMLRRIEKSVVCVDISEWLDKMSDPKFRDVLEIVDQNHSNKILFFSVPFLAPEVLKNVTLLINDIFFVRTLSVVPFDNEQIRELSEIILAEKGYTLEPEAWEIFDSRIAFEKNDGRFYGIDTVRKVTFDLLYLKQLSDVQTGADDKLIKRDEIKRLAINSEFDEKPGLEQLNGLIGIDGLKDQLMNIVGQIEFSLRDKSVKPPCIHMRFVGNPGTGKTTIARILGKILKEKGILQNGNFIEVFSRDLCGQYVGQTAPKTTAKCRDAYGSILFIDEAYALYDPDSGRDYGKEAIEALIGQMENHRSDFVVIMAGYPDEMDMLMNSNPGLRSRMPYVIEFPNYTRAQLTGIFMKMADGFGYADGLSETVKKYFDEMSDEKLSSKEFSNARFVRNLYERAWGKAVLRCQMDSKEPRVITAEDFTLASSDKDFAVEPKRKTHRVGF